MVHAFFLQLSHWIARRKNNAQCRQNKSPRHQHSKDGRLEDPRRIPTRLYGSGDGWFFLAVAVASLYLIGKLVAPRPDFMWTGLPHDAPRICHQALAELMPKPKPEAIPHHRVTPVSRWDIKYPRRYVHERFKNNPYCIGVGWFYFVIAIAIAIAFVFSTGNISSVPWRLS